MIKKFYSDIFLHVGERVSLKNNGRIQKYNPIFNNLGLVVGKDDKSDSYEIDVSKGNVFK